MESASASLPASTIIHAACTPCLHPQSALLRKCEQLQETPRQPERKLPLPACGESRLEPLPWPGFLLVHELLRMGTSVRGRSQRECDAEFRPPRLGLNLDLSIMSPYQAVNDIQAKSSSLTDRLRSKERIENPIANLRGYSWPIVHHLHGH